MPVGSQVSEELTVTSCDDFHPVDSIVELITSDHPNRIFRHDPTRETPMPPWPPRRGVDIFGDGQASEIDGWKFDGLPHWKWTAKPHTREVSTFALDGGILLPGSMATISCDRQLVYQSAEISEYWGGIDQMEPLISKKDGKLIFNCHALDDIPETAIPVSGALYNNYGHFLLDGLPIAYLLANAVRRPLVIACPRLTDWQRQVLELLNLDENLRILDRPTRFKTLIGSSCLSHHVARPTRYARAVFDALRFVVAFAPDASEKLFIMRAEQGSRVMNNADELKERLIKRGYAAIAPENHSVIEQIQMFSRAKVIVGATGAGMANIGFAPPGAKIVDIMAECRPDQWVRNLCFVLGHRWHGYVHRVDDIRGGTIGATHYPLYDFDFNLPLDDFEQALAVIESA